MRLISPIICIRSVALLAGFAASLFGASSIRAQSSAIISGKKNLVLDPVLSPTLEAMSSSVLLAPAALQSGLQGTGTVKYNWGGKETPGTFKVSWDPIRGLIFSALTELGVRSRSVTASEETMTDERGKVLTLGSHNASRSLLAYFPALELLGASADSSARIVSLGTVTLSSGEEADAIGISGHWPSNGVNNANQQIIFYLDHVTHLPLQRDDYVEFNTRGDGRLTREFVYQDYRSVGGVMFPFGITESLNGQMLYQLTLTSLQL